MKQDLSFEFKLIRCYQCGKFRFVEEIVNEEHRCTKCLRDSLDSHILAADKLRKTISCLRGTITRLKK